MSGGRLGGGLANQMRALGYRVRPPSDPEEGTCWEVIPPHGDTILLAKDEAEGWEKADEHWHAQNLAKMVRIDKAGGFVHDPRAPWQLIETAPAAGFIIGAWQDGSRWRAVECFQEADDWIDVFSDCIVSPTHWAPRPDALAQGATPPNPLDDMQRMGQEFEAEEWSMHNDDTEDFTPTVFERFAPLESWIDDCADQGAFGGRGG